MNWRLPETSLPSTKAKVSSQSLRLALPAASRITRVFAVDVDAPPVDRIEGHDDMLQRRLRILIVGIGHE